MKIIYLFSAMGHPFQQFAEMMSSSSVTSGSSRLLPKDFSTVGLGYDLYRCGSALVMFPPDKHTTMVAICRGTPKLKFQSASHTVVGQIYKKNVKKCGKQDIASVIQLSMLNAGAVYNHR